MKYILESFPEQIRGVLTLEGSKSQAVRAILLSTFAHGESLLKNVPNSSDIQDALALSKSFGAQIFHTEDALKIQGIGMDFSRAKLDFHAGASGISTLFFLPYLAFFAPESEKTYHFHPQMQARPKQSLLDALKKASLQVEDEGSFLRVKGSFHHAKEDSEETRLEVEGENSQYLSALLLSLPFWTHKKTWHIRVKNLQERPYIQMSLDFLQERSVLVRIQKLDGEEVFSFESGHYLEAKNQVMEGDWSSASTFLAALALRGGLLRLENLFPYSNQADASLLTFLEKRGMKTLWIQGVLHAKQEAATPASPFDWDASHAPDLFPTMIMLALGSPGTSTFTKLLTVRQKESDRVLAMLALLDALAIPYELGDDDLKIHVLKNFRLRHRIQVSSQKDHRIVMAMTLVGHFFEGEEAKIEILDAEAVTKTFPKFLKAMRQVGLALWGLPILILGAKHSGKSGLAQALGEKWNLPVRDLDEIFEKTYGESPRSFVKNKGEMAFREAEQKLLPSLLHEDAVIALGGGTCLHPQIQESIQAWPSIALEPDFDQQVAWIQAKGAPPHFTGDLREALQKRLQKLEPLHRDLALYVQDSTLAPKDYINSLEQGIRQKTQSKILLLHGPNLNFLGLRNPHHYGSQSQENFVAHVKRKALEKNILVEFFQSNHEGELLDFLQKNALNFQAILVNAGAFTHSSYALHDALLDTNLPCVEVHFSKLEEREIWRQNSLIRPACLAHFSGENSYSFALDFLCQHVLNS